jgi:methylglutaconyl-CoA hydratase
MNIIEYATRNAIATITLNRPEKRNALNPELIAGLTESLNKAEKDAEVKVVILKANGEAFCAGADLAYLQKLQHFSYEENLADSLQLKDLFLKLYSLKKITVAQVQGPALAGGCGLASVCDFCFAAHEATFGYTEVRIGFVPALVSVFLIRKTSEVHASKLLLTGNFFTADEMKHMGLVTDVFNQSNLEEGVNTFVKKLLTTNSHQAMLITKQAIISRHVTQLDSDLLEAARLNATSRGTDDCKRGIAAFLSKQKIDWTIR